jgi:4-hydroxy-tetrahydrodipicolinate reductase
VESQEFLAERSQGARLGNVRIHAVRLPGFVATQEVMLGAQGQRLILRHETINRECFMPGVLLACKKISGRVGLIYGLEKLL